jgi:hypothetical protein
MLTIAVSDMSPLQTRGFVYEAGAGEDTFVYVIDNGVNVHVENVSTYWNIFLLQF